MNTSIATGMKFWYDDVNGTPVDITAFVLSINDIEVSNNLQKVTPYGVSMPVFIPTGMGEYKPVTLGFLYKTGTGSIDELFGNRVPEDVTAVTRTFTVQYLTGRTTAVETHLDIFKRTPNVDNGLTKASVTLQPTGLQTEVVP